MSLIFVSSQILDFYCKSSPQMQPQESQSSFRQQIEVKTFQFLQSVSKICQSHNLFFCQKAQLFNTIFNYFQPFGEHEVCQDRQLPNFLEVTLNNQSEKRLKRKFGFKQITQVSGSTKLFGNIQPEQSMLASSKILHSIKSHKSAFNYQNKIELNNILIQTPPESKKNQEEENLSNQNQENHVLSYNPQYYFQNKKSYKIFTTEKKYQIINYSIQHGIKQASLKYEIPLSRINFWSRSMTKKKGVRGRKPVDPGMQERVCQWLIKELNNGAILTQKAIRQKAKQISGSQQFKASKGWLEKFFKRRPELFKKYTKNRIQGGSQDRDEEIVKKQEEQSDFNQNHQYKIKEQVFDQEENVRRN